MCVHRGRESYLTIAEVDFAMNGYIVLCQSTNIVEGEEKSKEESVTLKVLGKHLHFHLINVSSIALHYSFTTVVTQLAVYAYKAYQSVTVAKSHTSTHVHMSKSNNRGCTML